MKDALIAYQKAIDTLYTPTNKVITSGRDPSILLCKRIIDRYEENYEALGEYDTPRNNAILRKCFGYAQRFSPINLMQAYAHGPAYIIEEKKKLARTLEYRHWMGHSILPLDSDPVFRLGHEYFACGVGCAGVRGMVGIDGRPLQNFFQSKTAAVLQSCVMQSSRSDCQ